MLRSGEADIVIAGGSEALSKFHLNGFNTLHILDTEVQIGTVLYLAFLRKETARAHGGCEQQENNGYKGRSECATVQSHRYKNDEKGKLL